MSGMQPNVEASYIKQDTNNQQQQQQPNYQYQQQQQPIQQMPIQYQPNLQYQPNQPMQYQQVSQQPGYGQQQPMYFPQQGYSSQYGPQQVHPYTPQQFQQYPPQPMQQYPPNYPPQQGVPFQQSLIVQQVSMPVQQRSTADDVRESTMIQCPFCKQTVKTFCDHQIGTGGWICVLIWCLFFSPAAFFPCCCACCQDVVHYCPQCKKCVGRGNYSIC